MRDITGDGRPEIVLGMEGGVVLIYEHMLVDSSNTELASAGIVLHGEDTSIVFVVSAAASLPGAVNQLALADIDGDGDADIIASTDGSSGAVHVITNGCCLGGLSTLGTSTPMPDTAPPLSGTCTLFDFEIILETENTVQSDVIGAWSTLTDGTNGPFSGSNYLSSNGRRSEQIYVEYPLTAFPSGFYRLSVAYVPGSDRSESVVYQVVRDGQLDAEVHINQKMTPDNAPYHPLTTDPVRVTQGQPLVVRVLTETSAIGVVIADALRVGKCVDVFTSSSSTTTTTTTTSTTTTT